MEYVILLVLFVVVLMVKSSYDRRKKQKQLLERLKNSWGEVPEEEYSSEKFQSIQYYYNQLPHVDGEIDSITWNDLSMDEIYMLINQTGSAMGEEYLYALLRRPVFDQGTLEERNRLIHFFSENPEERLKLQYAFHTMGKLKQVSIYEYINRTEKVKISSTVPHYLMAFGLLFALFTIPFIPNIGIPVSILLVSNNILQYYRKKGKMEAYADVFSYIIRMLNHIEEITKLNISGIQDYNKTLSSLCKLFQPFKRNSFLIASGNSMSGDLMDIFMDYERMLFHSDLIKFNKMLEIVRKYRKELNQLYETIGLLDSMLAAASFRELMQEYSEPSLHKKSSPFLQVSNIYHPFIDDPIKNSIRTTRCVLITGSNASGKSTFLKTLAINAILAQSIDTVLADSYEASFFRVYSSMALQDNIISQESYYMVEIRSLKRILDQMRGEIPILCFVDEVLRGTNTLERIAASSEILYCFATHSILAFAATHDAELTHMMENFYDNYHFRERIEKKDILFDYKLHSGRAVSKNAIQLLGIMGYQENIIKNATETANYFLEKGQWPIIKPHG